MKSLTRVGIIGGHGKPNCDTCFYKQHFIRAKFRADAGQDLGPAYIDRLLTIIRTSSDYDQKEAALSELSREYCNLGLTATTSENPVLRMDAFKKLTEFLDTKSGDQVIYTGPGGNLILKGESSIICRGNIIINTIFHMLDPILDSQYSDSRLAAAQILGKIDSVKYSTGEALIAIYSDYDSAKTAFEKILSSDADSIYKVALSSMHGDLRREAVEKLVDVNYLIKLTINSSDQEVFLVSFGKLKGNNDAMLQIAKSQKEDYRTMEEKEDYIRLRVNAVQELKGDKEALENIAHCRWYDNTVREAASELLTA
ncbi:MAG: hypothetical protein WC501_04920 [Candidatus Micrarchaeia archaeon]